MKSHVQKWGNSLALRIPKTVAEDLGWKLDTEVEVTSVKGKLVITPVAVQSGFNLKRLLAQITDDNRHHEVEPGTPQGNESW